MSTFKIENTTTIPTVLPEIPTQGAAPVGGVFTNPLITVDNEGRIRSIEEGSGSATVSLPAGSLQYHHPVNVGSLAGESFLAYNALGNDELQLNTKTTTLPNGFGPNDTLVSGRHVTFACDAGRRIDFNRNNSGAAADCSWSEGLQIRNNFAGTSQQLHTSLIKPVIAVNSDHVTPANSQLTFFKDSGPNPPAGFTAANRPQLNNVPVVGDVNLNASKINELIDLLKTYGLAI